MRHETLFKSEMGGVSVTISSDENGTEACFEENGTSGHIRFIPVTEIRDKGIEKAYQLLEKAGFNLPSSKYFKDEVDKVLRACKIYKLIA